MMNRARKYIGSVKWQLAKSNDHEYTVRKWNPQLDTEFAWFVIFIRDVGIAEKFAGRKYIYFYLDGKRYWTMGAPLGITIIINRCPAEPPNMESITPKGGSCAAVQ